MLICSFRALKELVEQLDSEFGRDKDFYIGFEGSFGSKHVTPRSLSARNLNNLVCIEGIVTKCSLVCDTQFDYISAPNNISYLFLFNTIEATYSAWSSMGDTGSAT